MPAAEARSFPLLGRAGELEALTEVLDGVRETGASGAAIIEGEAGIGKTRLLEEVLASRPARSFRVLRGASD